MRSGSPAYDLLYTGLLGKEKEKSLDTYGSWDAGSQAFKTSTSSSTSNSKSETLMSPYGDYDMGDSSFFAHTTRLNIIGPNPNSTRFLRRRSSPTKNLLINCGERSIATAASSIVNHLRSRSPLGLLVPEKRTSPTDPYLRLSQESSLPLADPTASRKLLVLGLNNALLLRTPHPKSNSCSNNFHRPSRIVYPRPYLPSFCAYISHPTTLQWLDTMVWSSAQTHSVNDMVDKCFGTHKKVLKAVWARDTLGLNETEYRKWTPRTVKDLARPWECIWSIPNQSRPENPNSEVDAGRDNHPSEPQRHSALTTVLLDDSAVKAVLQPWNILCVSEYRLERCNLDIKIALRERERKWRAQQERKRTWPAERNRVKEIAEEEMTRDGTATDAAVKSSEETTTDIESNEAELKRKRKEKRLFELNKLLEQLEMQGKEGVEEEERYDELLLAVIGVLDALKHVGNVAGWMRGGGLVRVVSADQEAGFNSSKRPIFIQPQTLLDQATGVPSSTAAEAAASSTTPTETSGNNMTSGSTPTPIPHTQFQHLLWHKRPCVLSYWVQRGRKALSELGIDIIDGVGPYSGLELGSQMQRKF